MTRQDYVRKLKDIAKDTTKFAGLKGSMTGRAFLEAMDNDILIQHEIKHIFVLRPTFVKFTETDVLYRKLIKIKIPNKQQWEKLCDYQEG